MRVPADFIDVEKDSDGEDGSESGASSAFAEDGFEESSSEYDDEMGSSGDDIDELVVDKYWFSSKWEQLRSKSYKTK